MQENLTSTITHCNYFNFKLLPFTFESWDHPPKHLVSSHPGILTSAELYQHGGQPHHQQHHDVRDEEAGASVLKTHVREPPDIAQTNSQTQAGEEELAVVVPALSLLCHDDDQV